MKIPKCLGKRTAGIVLLVAFGLLVILQLLILAGVILYAKVWGGQLNERNYMAVSIVSVLIIAVSMIAIGIKMDLILSGKAKIFGSIGAWLVFVYLVLNFVGNISSAVTLENLVFAPITFILAFFAFILAISK